MQPFGDGQVGAEPRHDDDTGTSGVTLEQVATGLQSVGRQIDPALQGQAGMTSFFEGKVQKDMYRLFAERDAQRAASNDAALLSMQQQINDLDSKFEEMTEFYEVEEEEDSSEPPIRLSCSPGEPAPSSRKWHASTIGLNGSSMAASRLLYATTTMRRCSENRWTTSRQCCPRSWPTLPHIMASQVAQIKRQHEYDIETHAVVANMVARVDRVSQGANDKSPKEHKSEPHRMQGHPSEKPRDVGESVGSAS